MTPEDRQVVADLWRQADIALVHKKFWSNLLDRVDHFSGEGMWYKHNLRRWTIAERELARAARDYGRA